LVIADTGVRALYHPPKPRITEPTGFSPFEKTPKGLYIYKAGARFSHIYDVATDRRGYFGKDGRIDYRINELGFRGEEIDFDKPPGIRRILCLGDSFTFGEGVREENAWPQRLGRAAGPGFEVINAGVQGYSLDHEATLLFLYVRKMKPDIVVIGFFMNDAMPFQETVADHMLMTETSPSLSPMSRISALWRLLEQRQVEARQARGYLEALHTSFSSQAWADTRARIIKLRELADHDGFKIVAIVFPLLYNLQDYPLERERREVVKAFEDAGIEVEDLLDAYRNYQASDLWVHPRGPPSERNRPPNRRRAGGPAAQDH
jgi:hypothetical protein